MTSLPDIGKAAQLLKFSVELPEHIKGEGAIELSILSALEEGKIKGVVQMIKSIGKDNAPYLEEIIGKELLNEIINY